MNDSKQLNNKGFTLIELLVALAISGFIILAAYSFVLVGTKSYETNNKEASIQEEAGYVTNLVGESIITGKWKKSQIDLDYDGNANDIRIQLGDEPADKVLFYQSSQKQLLIYKNSDITPSSPLGSNPEDHLLSKNVDSFKAEYKKTSASAPDTKPTSLINIKIKIVRKGRTSSSEHEFEMRNKE